MIASLRILLAALLLLTTATARGADELKPGYATMKLLFCAYGSIGLRPLHPPPGFETQFAVAVIEVNSSFDMPNAPEPDIMLFDQAGKPTKTNRVISVEVFDEPYVAGDGNFAYYLDTNPRGRTRSWNRTLPGGMIHLRVHVALATQDFLDFVRCRVTVGPYKVEGPVDGTWPT
jgi:hypothetical protein